MSSAEKMPHTSKIVAYGIEFQDAMTAALAVAGNKPPFDVVQLRAASADGGLLVCARDEENKLAVAITVGTTMVDVLADRDEVIEISKSDARALKAMKVKRDDDEDEPMIGLIIAEQSITRTDESGFGLGIRQARVRRATWPGEPLAIGDVEAMLTAASDALPGESAKLSPKQWKSLASAASSLGLDFQVRALEATDDLPTRVLVTADRFTAFAALPKPAAEVHDGEDGAQELSFADAVQKVKKSGAKLTVVNATPPKGLA